MVEKVLQLNKEKSIFWMLIVCLVFFAAFYAYCVHSTVRNVVTRQNLEAESARISLSIGTKEFQYISLRNNISLEKAHTLGFTEVATKSFVGRGPSAQVSYLPR